MGLFDAPSQRLVTKRATATMGSAGGVGTGSFSTTTDGCMRYLNTFVVTPTRFRFRIRNSSALGAAGGALNGKSLWIGTPTFPSGGAARWAGAFASAPTKLVTGPFTVPANATDYVSSWITNTGNNYIAARQPFAISLGVTNVSGASVTVYQDRIGGGGFWNSAGASDDAGAGATGTPNGGAITLTSWIDVRIEYEYATAVDSQGMPEIPVGLFVGDSITAGATGPTTISLAHSETWVGAAGLARKFAATNLGVAGSTAAGGWLAAPAATGYYSRADLTGNGLPDFAVISLGINDVVANATFSALETNIVASIQNVQSLGVKRIYLATMIPAGAQSPMSITGGATTSGSSAITMGSTFGLLNGTPISGTGIPASSFLIVTGPTTANLVNLAGASANATATGTGLTFTCGATGYATTTSMEMVRHQVNQWQRGNPYGTAGVIDFDKTLATAIPSNVDPAFLTLYPHPDAAGYARMATAVKF